MFKNISTIICLTLILLVLFTAPAFAEVPQSFNYQGILLGVWMFQPPGFVLRVYNNNETDPVYLWDLSAMLEFWPEELRLP